VLAQGGLTVLFVRRVFRVPAAAFSLAPALALGAATGLAALALHPVVEGSGVTLVALVALEAVLAAAYFGALALAGAGWTALLPGRRPK
jgi:hypothetical protein